MISLLRFASSLTYRIGHMYRHFCKKTPKEQFRLAAKHYGTTTPRIFIRAVQLYLAGRFLPDESRSKGLLDPKKPFNDHVKYFSDERLNGYQKTINSPNAEMCRDKLLFNPYCLAHALPVAEILGIISSHGSRTGSGLILCKEEQWENFIKTDLPSEFIAKPRSGNKGRGIQLMGIGNTSEASDVRTLSIELQKLIMEKEDYILEKRIILHDSIAQLTGTKGLSSLRVFTLVDLNGNSTVMDAYFRVIVNDSITDNISNYDSGKLSGNILAIPDLANGIITSAWIPNENGVGFRDIQDHPRTGLPISGFQLPMWEEVCKLACRAASVFVPIRTIGWDIAITPTGPILIEANERYQHAGSGERVIQLRESMMELKMDLQKNDIKIQMK